MVEAMRRNRERRHRSACSLRPCGGRQWLVRIALAGTLGIALLIGIACRADPGYRGRSSAEWIGELDARDPNARMDAIEALRVILTLQPRSPEVVDALISALNDSTDAVRVAAGRALSTEGVRAPAALPGLLVVLADSAHPSVRAQAADILGAFGSAGGPAARSLAHALADPVVEVRMAAASALGRLGRAGAPSGAALARSAATDPSAAVRTRAVAALAEVRSGDPTLVQHIVPMLADQATEVRVTAVRTLGRLGPAAASAAEALARLLGDPSPTVRAAAAYALGEIGPAARGARDALARARSDPDSNVAFEARDALGVLEGRPRVVRPDHEPTAAERCGAGSVAAGQRC